MFTLEIADENSFTLLENRMLGSTFLTLQRQFLIAISQEGYNINGNSRDY